MAFFKKRYYNLISTISSHIGSINSDISTGGYSDRITRKAKAKQGEELNRIDGFIDNTLRLLLPYDVICLTLQCLRLNDLLQCAKVCQLWCEIVLGWPEFWNRLSLRIPRPLERHTIKAIMHNHVLCLNGSLGVRNIHDIILFFTSPHKRLSIQVIQFYGVTLQNRVDTCLLSHALQHTNTIIDRVEFFDCAISQQYMIYPILTACSRISHVSFSQSVDKAIEFYNFTHSLMMNEDIIVSHIKFSKLTYLKLAGTQTRADELAGVLRRCPCLEDLLLDSNGSFDQGCCIRQAIKHCHRLQNLVVNKGAEIPSCMAYARRPARTHGIYRLVLAGGCVKYDPQYTTKIFKKYHNTLEQVYLQYDTGGGTVSLSALQYLARNGVPHLRALWLTKENTVVAPDEAQLEPLDTTLATLLSTSPLLERLHLQPEIYTNDIMLKAIAKHCPKLYYLEFRGYFGQHSNEGLLRFAAETKAPITFLEISIDYSSILPLVKALPSLRYLRVYNLSNPPTYEMPCAKSIQVAESIFIRRKGSLTFTLP